MDQDLLSATGAGGSTVGVSACTKYVPSSVATSASSLRADCDEAQELSGEVVVPLTVVYVRYAPWQSCCRRVLSLLDKSNKAQR